jgi:hypothetical protein
MEVIFECILGKWDGEMWIGCSCLRIRQWRTVVNVTMELLVPLKAVLANWMTIGLSRRTLLHGVR